MCAGVTAPKYVRPNDDDANFFRVGLCARSSSCGESRCVLYGWMGRATSSYLSIDSRGHVVAHQRNLRRSYRLRGDQVCTFMLTWPNCESERAPQTLPNATSTTIYIYFLGPEEIIEKRKQSNITGLGANACVIYIIIIIIIWVRKHHRNAQRDDVRRPNRRRWGISNLDTSPRMQSSMYYATSHRCAKVQGCGTDGKAHTRT